MTDYSKMALGTKIGNLEVVECPHCHRPGLKLGEWKRIAPTVDGVSDTASPVSRPSLKDYVLVSIYVHSEPDTVSFDKYPEPLDTVTGRFDVCPTISLRTAHEGMRRE
jgi:hypothetical protein